MRLIRFDTIDSTNAEAHRRATEGERGPLWLQAERQAQGRGRLGRSWVSEPGNLYATHLFTLSGMPALASQVSFAAALAVLEMAQAFLPPSPPRKSTSLGAAPPPHPACGHPLPREGAGERGRNTVGREEPGLNDNKDVRLSLKWPNDVLLEGAKFCGILPEAIARPDGTTIILGCGVNLAHAPAGTPYPVTHLSAHGATATPAQALDALDRALNHWLAIWQEGRGFPAIREAWLGHAHGLGGPVEAGGLTGTFAGLASDGALLMTLPGGDVRAIHAGEVRFAAGERLVPAT